MKAFALITLALALAGLPALGQGQSYTYNYGSSRVVNQNQTGLYRPAATQIGAGTMSQTARGLPPGGAGSMSNPMLPRVNMGANIRTPGDTMYQGGGGQVQYQQQAPVQYQGSANPGLPPAHMGANIGTAGDGMRSDLRRPQTPQPRRYYYQQQNQQQSTGIMYHPSSGTATYAEHSATSDGARRF